MMNQQYHDLFHAYCFGPADIFGVTRGDSTMWLSLRDCAGRTAEARYDGCVYWPLIRTGMHLSLVQQVRADQLLSMRDCAVFPALQQITSCPELLLREWEEAGLRFYLHTGSFPEREFLITAARLFYREKDI